jgi:uncharacterized iron-regulated membrane protein
MAEIVTLLLTVINAWVYIAFQKRLRLSGSFLFMKAVCKILHQISLINMSKDKVKGFSIRKLFNDIHLWLGIASGLVLFVVCLSGTIYTFRTEMVEWIERDKYYVSAAGDAKVLDRDVLVAKLEYELKGKVIGLEILQDKEKACRVTVAPQSEVGDSKQLGGEKGKGGTRPKTYLVDPYTGQVKGGSEGPAAEFFQTVMKLHRWLLMEDSGGKIIVGVSTIIFVFMVLTGLVLWFPVKLKNWKQGFRIKTSGNWKRLNHDLHNTLGFYSFILLLIMALTGLCWSFEWYREGLSAVMGDKVFKGRGEKPLTSDISSNIIETPTLQSLVEQVEEILPYEGNYRISIPNDSVSAVVFYKSKAGFFSLVASDKVQLDQYTGELLKVERFADKALNEQIVSLIKPLHTGEVFGTFSKILYFISCLIATSLPITGTIIWINKLRKKSKKANKAVPA